MGHLHRGTQRTLTSRAACWASAVSPPPSCAARCVSLGRNHDTQPTHGNLLQCRHCRLVLGPQHPPPCRMAGLHHSCWRIQHRHEAFGCINTHHAVGNATGACLSSLLHRQGPLSHGSSRDQHRRRQKWGQVIAPGPCSAHRETCHHEMHLVSIPRSSRPASTSWASLHAL